jgi:hypothetical protein
MTLPCAEGPGLLPEEEGNFKTFIPLVCPLKKKVTCHSLPLIVFFKQPAIILRLLIC